MPTGIYKHKSRKHSEKTKQKIRIKLLGHKLAETTKEKIRQYNLKNPSRYWLGKKRPEIAKKFKGENSHFWKGGLTSINKIIRESAEYKLWRKAVFERDNYTCIWCGEKSGSGKTIELNADHIKPFYLFPELRFAIDNGRTLCRSCHQTTNTWGKSKYV